MKTINRRALFLLMAAGIFETAWGQSQKITVNHEQLASNEAAVLVEYDVSNGRLTTGLGFRLHFDSSSVEIIRIVSLHNDSNLGFQISDDVEDLDDNPLTDQYISSAWVDLSGQWPANSVLPTTLYRVEYRQLQPSNETDFSVSLIETAIGFDFVSQVNRGIGQ